MYRPGDLKSAGPTDYQPSDAREDYADIDYPGIMAYLPHSCDSWVIGGPEQIRALIADLTKLLEDSK